VQTEDRRLGSDLRDEEKKGRMHLCRVYEGLRAIGNIPFPNLFELPSFVRHTQTCEFLLDIGRGLHLALWGLTRLIFYLDSRDILDEFI
jgi:hypothetical protein